MLDVKDKLTMEKTIDYFEEVSKYLAESKEVVGVSDVFEMIMITNKIMFERLKEENKMLIDFLETVEVSITTSLVMNLSILTKKGNDTEEFIKKMENREKPN